MKTDHLSLLKQNIRRTDLVTLDVFDTCLHRAVARPVHVFDIAYLRWRDGGGADDVFPDAASFRKARVDAEARARRVRPDREDITLEDIYRQLADAGLEGAAAQSLMQAELACELDLCFPNPVVLEVYRECLSRGIAVAFISDMYLPGSQIAAMLAKCRFEPRNLFVSSEVGLVKGSGRLFAHALASLGVDPKAKRVLHVGDNRHADVVAAEKAGLSAVHFRYLEDLDADVSSSCGYLSADSLETVRSVAYGLVRKAAIERGATTDFESIGYRTFGPAFAGFLIWLSARIKEHGAKRVLCFARDARIIHELAELGQFAPREASIEYVYVSRHSLAIGAVRTLDEPSLHALARTFIGYTERELFEKWFELAPELAEGLGPDLASPRVIDHKSFARLYATIHRHHLAFLAAARRHREHAERYLARSVDGSKTALIDIGWNGNMQLYWHNVVRRHISRPNVIGLYFGLFPEANAKIAAGHRMSGWLEFLGEACERRDALYQGGVALLELAFSADHGTTVGYDKPHAAPVLRTHEGDAAYREAGRQIQAGMKRFWRDASELLPNVQGHDFSAPEGWTSPFFRLVTQPEPREAELLGEVRHDAQGGSNSNALRLAPALPMLQRLVPWRLKRTLRKAIWREGARVRNRKAVAR